MTFTWEVVGWPLNQTTLDCGNLHSAVIEYDTDGNTYFNSNPPKKRISLSLTTENLVFCTLRDGDRVLDSRTITRVGYGCQAGEKGVGKQCVDCPDGETSTAGSSECLAVTSSCVAGEYGVLSCESDGCTDHLPSTLNVCEI